MKTTSINEALYSMFGLKQKLTPKDFAQVKELTISQFGLNGVLQVVDFSELAQFPKLESIIIRDCNLNNQKIGYALKNAKSISFIRCNLTDVTSKAFPKKLNDVYISDCKGFSIQLNSSNVDYFEIHKMELAASFSPKIRELDISGCTITNYDFLLSPPLKVLTISQSQYKAHKKLFDKAPFLVKIMESNGQFVGGTTGGKA